MSMKQYDWEQIVKQSESGQLSKEELQTAIAQVDGILKFIRSQVQYGRSMQNWQRAALDNINQQLQ